MKTKTLSLILLLCFLLTPASVVKAQIAGGATTSTTTLSAAQAKIVTQYGIILSVVKALVNLIAARS